MPQNFQSSEKRKKSESTNEIRSYLRQLRSYRKIISSNENPGLACHYST